MASEYFPWKIEMRILHVETKLSIYLILHLINWYKLAPNKYLEAVWSRSAEVFK